MSKDTFIFSSSSKRNLIILAVAGLVLIALGVLSGSGGHGHGAEAEGGHHFHWMHRLYVNLWINNVFFTGLGVIGVLWIAIQYAAMAGWSTYFKRVPEAFGIYIPFAAALTFILFYVTNHTAPHHFHIFHWLDHSLYDTTSENFDSIIDGKKGYLNEPFFLVRMAFYFLAWGTLFYLLRKQSLQEDLMGGNGFYSRSRIVSTIFIIIFAVTSSMAAWDWVMSIDTHWFSTMFGWYNFASWWVAGIAAFTLLILWLNDHGYLPQLNRSHLHDLGKFLFAFSIFWTYIWFSQFMLIYYANIPEESVYFIERLKSGNYQPIFYINIFVNFIFPFLFLMTRDSKRHKIFLKIAASAILLGHWLDFYLMITPGTLQENGAFGLMEIGSIMVFASLFLFVVLWGLTKAPLVAKNHPMLEESLHHHI